jgi:hypothetical protein
MNELTSQLTEHQRRKSPATGRKCMDAWLRWLDSGVGTIEEFNR